MKITIFQFREYNIDIFDNRFSPPRLTIEEGDKVWFTWNKSKVNFFYITNRLKVNFFYSIYF